MASAHNDGRHDGADDARFGEMGVVAAAERCTDSVFGAGL
jgi:hypothetical protein